MLTRLSTQVAGAAKWWLILIALIGSVLSATALLNLPVRLSMPGFRSIDTLFFPSAETTLQTIASLDDAGRLTYRYSEIVFDGIYMLFYTAFFALVTSVLLRKSCASDSPLQKLNLLVLGVFVFDVIENTLIVALLMTHPIQSRLLAQVLMFANGFKWICVVLTCLTTIIGLLAMLLQFARNATKS